MKNLIVDIASLGQDALVKALENKELNILGVTVSPDVENYDDLCNLNINTVKQVKDVPVFKGAQRPMLLKDYIAYRLSGKLFCECSIATFSFYFDIYGKCYWKEMLEAIRYVDLVIPEENWEQKRTDIHEYHIDTFVMGDDWKGKFDFLSNSCEVVYLSRTPEISTTKIKQDLK